MKKIFFIFGFSLIFSGCGKKIESSLPSTYTYRTTTTNPSTWSPTDSQMSSESSLNDLMSVGLYDFILNEDCSGYKIICELAEKMPEDVSSEYKHLNGQKMRAWRFSLIKNACFDDGTKIDSSVVEYSLMQYLNPKMKNYRASTWYQDILSLENAEDYYNGKVEWEKVGFEKNDEWTFTLILTKPVKEFFVIYKLSGGFLVNPKIYEACKKQAGDIVKSSYGTSVETSSSYGPYRMTNFQTDKIIEFEKNPTWYGWTDGKHENQFMTTNYEFNIITEHSTILNLFLQGKLDDTALDANDLKLYGNSEWRQTTPESFTWKWTFNTDYESLKRNQSKGINKTILCNLDFRHGISLSLDRQKFVDTITPASDAGFGLINYSYVSNTETGALYRESKEAVEALCKFYDAETEDDITGYNLDLAKNYIQAAYEDWFSKGEIGADDVVQIDYHTYNTSDGNMRSVTFLQDALNAASEGTDLEGRIVVHQVTDEDYYSNLKNGNVDVAMTGWGGAAMDPYGCMWCYCDPDAINEIGFKPKEDKLTVEVQQKKITKTYYDWYAALCEGEYAIASDDVRNSILAQMEYAILAQYRSIPIRYMNSVSLLSQRIVEKSPEFVNQLVGYGGIRFMTYTMDDAHWDEYCKKNRNKLKY